MEQGWSMLLLLTIGTQLTLCWAGKQYLNEYIKHYEGIYYSTATLHNSHLRAKRSVDSEVNLQFFAHGRDFHLRLRRDTSTFSRDARLQDADGHLTHLDVSHIYEGHVVGDPDSYVHGSIIQGIFAGQIRTRRTTYHVDKTEVYFRESQAFHSVIYSEDDMVIDPFREKRHAHGGMCGNADDTTRDWMETELNTAPVEEHVEKRAVRQEARELHHHGGNMYTAAMNRVKRAQPQGAPKLTCQMFLQTDPKLWDYMTAKKGDGGLGYDEARANEEIVSLLSDHASGIKLIYTSTNFKYKDMSHNPVDFVVHRVQVNNTRTVCAGDNKGGFCNDNLGANAVLSLHSFTNHSDFCLSFLFTYRDFPGGVVGMAWVAAPSGTGGVCGTYKKYYDKSGSTFYKNYNTGIVSLLNYGKRVPLRVSTITFAHEVGHSFGSPHDSGRECTPYSHRDPRGNYIMFASATSGHLDNNDKFSPCSIGNMTLVIDAVVNEKGGKRNCFVASNKSFCGNKILEGDEECDCGYDYEDCGDALKCCGARSDGEYNGCRLKPVTHCSFTNHPCCNSACRMVAVDENKSCADETECSHRVTCNGTSEWCPQATAKEDNIPCNHNTQICQKGVCSSSICKKIGWEQCYITEMEGKKVDRAEMCYVACNNSVTHECVSSFDKIAIAEPKNSRFLELLEVLQMENIQLQPGTPCDNFRGFCDVFHKCRSADSDGPLARLKHFLTSTDKVKDWFVKYWWAVILMILALIIFMALLLKLCAVHTPSTNPHRKPHRKIALPKAMRPRQRAAPPTVYVATIDTNF